MSQINDDLYAFLISEGIPPGHVSDMAYAWLILQGATPGHVNDMWEEYFSYPGILNTALVWLDETTMTVNGGNQVTHRRNKGTGGALYDLNAESSGAQLPVLDTFNGIDVIRTTDAIDTQWYEPTVQTNISQPYTAFVVAKVDSLNGPWNLFYDEVNKGLGNRNLFYVDGTQYIINAGFNNVTVTPSDADITIPRVFCVQFNGASSKLQATDTDIAIGNAGIDSFDYIKLYGRDDALTTNRGWGQEFIIIEGVVSDPDIIIIRDHLKAKYGILI